MDKRVLAHYNGDVTLANIQPSKRAKILAKYGPAATADADRASAA
jgi:alkane 1-monooxygenase